MNHSQPRRTRNVRHLAFAFALTAGLAAVSGCDLVAGSSTKPTESPLVPTPTPRRTLGVPSPTPQPTFFLYVVRANDTLTSIARRFRTSALSLSYWNRDGYPSLDPDGAGYRPNRIEAGWQLRLVPSALTDGDDLPTASPASPPRASPSTSVTGSAAP